MRLKILFFIFSVLLSLELQSCATLKDMVNPYDEQFHCRAKDTEGKCVDTPTAYQDARYPQPAVVEDPAKKDGKVYLFGYAISEGQPVPAPPINAKDAAKERQYKSIADLLDNPEAPLLKPPKILRILILPYKGERNELFMTRYAYLEVEKASWALTDIKEK